MKNKLPKERYSLGIESSADDFSIGISTFNGKTLANVTDAYIPQEGGIHPREAAQHHSAVASKVLAEALQESAVEPQDLSIVSFTQGPGLGPCLRTGATVARALASYLDIPLVGVNHCIAHIEIGKLKTSTKNPLTLYVSGGNTMIAAYESGRYRVFGETLDIALGNCLDVFAREANLHQKPGMPFGAIVEKLAHNGHELLRLPYTVKGMDVSLSGLLTAATTSLKKTNHSVEDICYSLQETAFSMITEITERALAHTGKNEVLLTGGVACNKRLQRMIESISHEHNAHFEVVPKEYAIDNGAMTAWTGILAFKHGSTTSVEKSQVRPRWRIEEVDVQWMK